MDPDGERLRYGLVMTAPAPRFALLLSFLLLGAAAPVAGQSAQDPPAEGSTPVQEEEVQSPDPVQPDERDDPPARETPTERPSRSTPPPADFPSTAAPAPPAVIVEQVPVPVPMPGPLPVDPLLNTVEELPVGDPYNNQLEVYPEIVTTEDEGGGLAWPLIIAAILLVLGAIAFLLARGPRRRATVVERAVEEPAFVPPVAAAPIAPAGRPRIDLRMRPLRAGVEGEGARIEFELTVLNEGPIEAEDVRVFTWMTATAGHDATRALLPPPGHVGTPPVTLAAGEARTLQASVALPRNELHGSSLLPAVVVDIRYRLPGGRDGRTAAAFSVGLPAGDELGPFPLDGTGLHQGVIALPLGEAVKT
jgi:hypothetical protein